MNNHPFFSTNRNIYDQSVFAATPSNLNGQNVLISQEQQRKMYDTLNTSIMGLQNPNSQWMDQASGNFVQAQKHYIPGGVMFTFNSQPPMRIYEPHPQGYMNQPMCCCNTNPNPVNYYPPTIEQQIAITGLQKHGLESLQYQQQLANNPFQLKFHHNSGTSCSDLLNSPTQVPGSRSMPDFANVSGIVQLQNQQYQGVNCENQECRKSPVTSADINYPPQPIEFSRNVKRLDLSTPPEKMGGNASEAESKESCDPKKRVCFADEYMSGKADKEAQVSLECPLCNAQNSYNCTSGNKKRSKSGLLSRKIRKRRDTESSSDSSVEESEKRLRDEKKSKKRRNKSDSQYCTEDSDSSV